MEFQIGDRVTMSNKALAAGLDGMLGRRDGVIASIPRDPDIVRVLRDGRQQPEYYHRSFWALAERAVNARAMCSCNNPDPLLCHECEESTGVCYCKCHKSVLFLISKTVTSPSFSHWKGVERI